MKKIAFTIVLNGMPFIKHQIDNILNNFDMWYIIEGPVKPIKDTDWCKHIPSKYLNDVNMSVDGTYEFLNQISHPKIKIIRPSIIDNKYRFWNGKLEMCNSFMDNVENCILMQIDVDEFWNQNILDEIFEYSENNDFTSMSFKCNFYIHSKYITTSENAYGDMWWDWKRLWKITDRTQWISHEPPTIDGDNINIDKKFTSRKQWIFDHYAYIFEQQVQFKEDFYGYENAVKQWNSLNTCNSDNILIDDYLGWVNNKCKARKYEKDFSYLT